VGASRLPLLIGQFVGYLQVSDMNRVFYGLVEEAWASAFPPAKREVNQGSFLHIPLDWRRLSILNEPKWR